MNEQMSKFEADTTQRTKKTDFLSSSGELNLFCPHLCL